MRKNLALEKQRAGKVTSGPSISFASPDLAEQVAVMGFDWIWLDGQHGQWTESTLNEAIARFLPTTTAPIVRVKSHEWGTINRTLDMGAMGIIVPMIQNAEQARAAVQAAFYPPKGLRSCGGMRLDLLGDPGTEDYLAHANDEIMMVVMVESELAINNVVEIMQVPGVDVVMLGPGDLMLDVRSRGLDAAYHEMLVHKVVAASRQTGVPVGYPCGGVAQAEQRVSEGFRFVCPGGDFGFIRGGMAQMLESARRW